MWLLWMTHMLVHKNLVTQFPGNLIGEPVVVKHAVVVVVGIIIIIVIIIVIIIAITIVQRCKKRPAWPARLCYFSPQLC